MVNKSYENYIFTNFNTEANEKGTHLFRLDNNVIKGAPYLDCVWIWPKAELLKATEAHSHPFDEVLAFFGTNPEDPKDLCGEIEFWLDDEQYILSNSCIIFIPKGLQHCPLIIRRIDRPVFHFSSSPEGNYVR